MEEEYNLVPKKITDFRIKTLLFILFISLAFLFIYAFGWEFQLSKAKKILVDKEFEMTYETMEGNKRVEKVAGPDSEMARETANFHIRGGLISIGIGLYFIGALFFMFKSKRNMLIAVWIAVLIFVVLWLYMRSIL